MQVVAQAEILAPQAQVQKALTEPKVVLVAEAAVIVKVAQEAQVSS